MTRRYRNQGFRIEKDMWVPVRSLDEIVFSDWARGQRVAEFLKVDCQGGQQEVFGAAARTLREQCLALVCEVEFFQQYRDQKTFSEMDLVLRRNGLFLYGLYPHYISVRLLDRKRYDTEERLLLADAVYFKDPASPENSRRRFSQRDLEVLLLSALLLGFYDFALELLPRCIKEKSERRSIEKSILWSAAGKSRALVEDAAAFIKKWRRSPRKRYLLTKRFIDRHYSNSSVDFLSTGLYAPK